MIASVMFISNQKLGDDYGNDVGVEEGAYIRRRGQTLLKDSSLLSRRPE